MRMAEGITITSDFYATFFTWSLGLPFIVMLILWVTKKMGLNTYLRSSWPVGEKSVFISGCDSGIGRSLALFCARLGFQVFAGCLDLESAGAQKLKLLSTDTTSSYANKVHVLSLDITNQESVENVVQYIKKHVGSEGLWALINNAGVLVYGEFEWYTWNQCRRQVEVNFLGTIRMTKACIPLIRKAKGRVINITSVNGKYAYPGISVYCGTKFAIEGFSDALRLEMRKFGVRVIVVEPGDYARLTSIMKGHGQNAQEMWNNMDPEARRVYDGYFQRYHQTAEENYGYTSPPSLESSNLFTDIQNALLKKEPKARYVSAPVMMRLFFIVLKMMPTRLSDQIISFIFSKVFKSKLGTSSTD